MRVNKRDDKKGKGEVEKLKHERDEFFFKILPVVLLFIKSTQPTYLLTRPMLWFNKITSNEDSRNCY